MKIASRLAHSNAPQQILRRWQSTTSQGTAGPFFEGWFYRLVSREDRSLAVIPGRFRSPESNYDFVQVFDGLTSELLSFEVAPKIDKTKEQVAIGDCQFRPHRLELAFEHDAQRIDGQIQFKNMQPWPGFYRHPAMGWFSWLPGLQCYHSVISMRHDIDGELRIDGSSINFDGGRGYLEKTWGRQFPDSWIWSQCFDFDNDDVQGMFLSLATVPMAGLQVAGLTAAVVVNGQLKKWGTWRFEQATITFDDQDVVFNARGWSEDLVVRWRDARSLGKRSPNVLVPTTTGLQLGVQESLNQSIKLTVMRRIDQRIICQANGTNAALDMVNLESMKLDNRE